MAEINTVLATQNMSGGGGVDERQSFTVNNAVADVALNVWGAPEARLRPALFTNYYIQPKDNITILSMGITLPHSFVLSDRLAFITLGWNDGGSGGVPLGDSGAIQLPFGSYEMALNTYLPWFTGGVLKYYLTMKIAAPALDAAAIQCRVSMAGVPAILNGTTQPIIAWLKIAHTLPLIA